MRIYRCSVPLALSLHPSLIRFWFYFVFYTRYFSTLLYVKIPSRGETFLVGKLHSRTKNALQFINRQIKHLYIRVLSFSVFLCTHALTRQLFTVNTTKKRNWPRTVEFTIWSCSFRNRTAVTHNFYNVFPRVICTICTKKKKTKQKYSNAVMSYDSVKILEHTNNMCTMHYIAIV